MSRLLQSRAQRAAAVVAGAFVLCAGGRARGADDLAAAKVLLQRLPQDPGHGPIVAAAASKATDAVNSSARLRAAGDEVHARAADGLALEWAETARDLARAADAEATASDLRRKAVDALARLERARSLVAEGIARVGRMRAELDDISRAAPKEHRSIQTHASDQPKRNASEAPSGPRPKDSASGDAP